MCISLRRVLSASFLYGPWLSEHGSGRQRELAAEFVEYILQRAEKAGEDVYRKAEEIVKEGMSRSSLTLKGFEREVEVEGRTYVVMVIDGRAEFGRSKSGKMLLRIRITAEVDGARREYRITYSRHAGINKAEGYATANVDAPGGREADAERLSALIKALTGEEPRIRRMKDGTIIIIM
jgi:hypothetical protein